MNLANFDLNLLLVFHAIYSEKSLTRAGRRLGLSQPAISHALNRLRQAFNNPLFTRKGNRMEPTPLAQQINPSVKSIIDLAQQTMAGQDTFDPRASERTFPRRYARLSHDGGAAKAARHT
jgi:DNA-binding transcriptional LysR family regulator